MPDFRLEDDIDISFLVSSTNNRSSFLRIKKPILLSLCIKDGKTIYENGLKFIFDLQNCIIFDFK